MPAKTRRTRASNHVAWPSPTQSLFGDDSSKARRDERQEAQTGRGKRRVVISLSPTPPPRTPARATRSNGSGSNGGSRNTAILVEDDEDEQSDTSDWEPETPPLPPTQGEMVPSKLSVDAEGADDDDDDDEDDFSTPPPPPGQELAHSPPPQASPPASPPPASPSPPSEAVAEEEGEASEGASEPDSEASASPEPQEPRKSIFDIHDQEEEDAMLAQLQALLPGSDEEASDSDGDDMDYEEKRNRRMMKNKAMLLQLGLAAAQPEKSSSRASPSVEGSSPLRDELANQRAVAADDDDEDDNHGEGPSNLEKTSRAPKKRRGRPSKAEKVADRASGRVINNNNARTTIRLAEDGTTTSLPLRGTTHELAYVYLPPPRARDPFIMIENFLVEAPKPPTPPPPSRSPTPPPAKLSKLPKGFKKMSKRKAVDADGVEKPVKRRKRERDVAANGEVKPPAVAAAAASSYSANEGVNCHQCRRKHASPLPMTCRKCRLHYCYGCMDVRYGAYDPEDPDDALYDNCRDTWNSKDTHWRCPKCRGICNCSLCLVKGGYKELLHGPGAKTAAAVAGEKGPAVKKRVTSLSTNTRGPKKEREHRSVRHYLENALGVFKTNKEGTGDDDVAVASDEEGVGPAELPTVAEDGDGVGDGGGRVRHPLRKLPKRGYMTLKRLEEQIAAVKTQLREERAKMSSRKVTLILVGVDDYSDVEEEGEEEESGLVQPPRRRLTLKLPEHRPAADEEENESDADGEDDVTAAAIFAATQGPSLFSSSAATEANVWVRSAMDVSDSESDDLMEPEEREVHRRHGGGSDDDDDDADGDDEEEEEEESEDELMDSDDEDEDEDEDDDDEVAEDARRSHSHSVHTTHSRRASAASSIISSASSGLSDPPSLSPLSSRRPSPIPPPPPKPKRLTGRAKSKASWAAPAAAAAEQSVDSSIDEGDEGQQQLIESYGHGIGDDTQQQQQQQRYKLLPIPAPIPSSLRPLNTADATSSPMHPGVAAQLQQPSTPGSSSHDEAEIRTRAGTRTRGRVQPTFGWA